MFLRILKLFINWFSSKKEYFKIRTKIGITVTAREICIQGGTSHYQGGTSHDQGGTSHGHQPDRARGDGDCPPMGGRGHRGRRGWGGRGAQWREGPPSGWMPSRRPGGGHYRWWRPRYNHKLHGALSTQEKNKNKNIYCALTGAKRRQQPPKYLTVFFLPFLVYRHCEHLGVFCLFFFSLLFLGHVFYPLTYEY